MLTAVFLPAVIISKKSENNKLSGTSGDRFAETPQRNDKENRSDDQKHDKRFPDDFQPCAAEEDRLTELHKVGRRGSLHDQLYPAGHTLHGGHSAGKHLHRQQYQQDIVLFLAGSFAYENYLFKKQDAEYNESLKDLDSKQEENSSGKVNEESQTE